jgi:hypothetical protein
VTKLEKILHKQLLLTTITPWGYSVTPNAYVPDNDCGYYITNAWGKELIMSYKKYYEYLKELNE